MDKSNFNKYPFIDLGSYGDTCSGLEEITNKIKHHINIINKDKIIIAIECYPGVFEKEILNKFSRSISFASIVDTKSIFKPQKELADLIKDYVTDDPVFGRLSGFTINDYFDTDKLETVKNNIAGTKTGTILLFGTGASEIAKSDILIYADMARWEIQQRQRKNEISNLGFDNPDLISSLKYKQAFFVDWRICDKLKTNLFDKWDFYLDTNDRNLPKMTSGNNIREAMNKAVSQPFELMPFFDPGPWGGQWMKEVCGLDKTAPNYAWCFNCVPEENSLLIKINDLLFEMPALNLVLYKPVELLGEKVYKQFGAEFPIRFDFLDTIGGGNLSLQVHPTTRYIKDKFGWPYTQDESYYILDAEKDAGVFLGLKEGISVNDLEADLNKADEGEILFPDKKYVNHWPAKKHDHFLIPGGTVHCSGKGCLTLEISATPYIFTFKLWDWGRMGLNGLPRPIHIDHGLNVIQFNRTTEWVEKNLINRIETVAEGEGWCEERTGLHELELIETRRYWFSKPFEVKTGEGVNVLNLVEGNEIIVESPDNSFLPFTVHYAETFIIPANVKSYRIRPAGNSDSRKYGIIKAYIR